MTRITRGEQKNAVSVLMDIFEMSNMREPADNEVDSLLQVIGTHGSMIDDVVIYEDDEMQYVHTRNMLTELKNLF